MFPSTPTAHHGHRHLCIATRSPDSLHIALGPPTQQPTRQQQQQRTTTITSSQRLFNCAEPGGHQTPHTPMCLIV